MSNVSFRITNNGEQNAELTMSNASPDVQMALVQGLFAVLGAPGPLRHGVSTIKPPFALEEATATLQPFPPEPVVKAVETPPTLQQKVKAEVAQAKKEIATAAASVVAERQEQPRFGTSIGEILAEKMANPKQESPELSLTADGTGPEPMDEDDFIFEEGWNYVSEATATSVLSQGDNIPDHIRNGYKIYGGSDEKHYKVRYWCGKCQTKSNHYIPEGTEYTSCHTCQASMRVFPAVPRAAVLTPDVFMNFYVAGIQKPIRLISQGQYDKFKKRRR